MFNETHQRLLRTGSFLFAHGEGLQEWSERAGDTPRVVSTIEPLRTTAFCPEQCYMLPLHVGSGRIELNEESTDATEGIR